MHCTQCGAEARGKFCAACGASLRALPCRSCGEQIQAGTRFCTACGSPVGAGSPPTATAGSSAADPRGGVDAGWWVAGGLLLVVLIWVGVGVVGGGSGDAPVGATASAPFATSPSGGTPPDLSTMTPREAADRLFNRVMAAAANENAQEANTFLPMALDAYELARPLNADGLFHLALLQRAAGDTEGSLASALEGLEGNPDHLLNLSSAAEASLALGDSVAGLEYYRRMMDAWDREIAAGRIEYEEHDPLLPLLQENAEAALAGGGA